MKRQHYPPCAEELVELFPVRMIGQAIVFKAKQLLIPALARLHMSRRYPRYSLHRRILLGVRQIVSASA
jgi:hypothetical protein